MLGHASVVSIPEEFNMIDYIHHLFLNFQQKNHVENVFLEDLGLIEEKRCSTK